MSTPIDAFRAAQQKAKHGNVEDEEGIQYWQDKLVGKTYIGGGNTGALSENQVGLGLLLKFFFFFFKSLWWEGSERESSP